MENNRVSEATQIPQVQNVDDNKMNQLVPDWQVSKTSMVERISVMFNNELMADVHFIVGSDCAQRRIPAHKFILTTASPVFFAMFYGGLAEDKKDITIPDVEPQAFLNLLEYLYCDDVTLDGDTVLSTLYAAKKYILPHLERVCIKYLETNVDANNACLLLLSQGEIFEDPELKQRCWDIIDHRAEEVFKSDSFTEIDYQMLEQMLTRGTLRAKETVVFAAATRWAEAECARQGRFVVPEQCREVLGDAFYLLRFPTMSQSEFANDAVQSELLSNKEILDVFLHFNADSKPKLRFPAIPRVELKIAACSRFQFHKAGWSFATAKSNCIRFSVDKAISVAGFGLYGSIQAAEYEVDIGITETDGTVLRLKRHRVSVDGSSNTTHVLFDSPVRIKADTFYTASFVVDYDGHGHYGAGGMSSVTCIDGTKFTFVDSSQSKYTNGLQGQIPEILYYC